MTDDHLSELLDLWKTYMEQPSPPRGFPRRSLVLEGRYTVGTDFDEMAEEMDEMHAKAVEAAVDSLPMNERISVYHVKLERVWRLPRIDLQATYLRAREMLKTMLDARGIV